MTISRWGLIRSLTREIIKANAANAERCARLGLPYLVLNPADYALLPEQALILLFKTSAAKA